MAQPPEEISATPKPEAKGFWSKHGCLVWLILPWVLAIPVWLLAFPESYDRALDFVVDALAVVLFIAIAAILGLGVVRSRRTLRPLGYLFAVIALGLAFLVVWNIVALYTKAGTGPVTIFGWRYSAQPGFYALSLLVVLFLAVGVWHGLGKGKQSGK
jgi:hypothetical protein